MSIFDLQFWKVGYGLCHGICMRCMCGSTGTDTEVNFAVPTLNDTGTSMNCTLFRLNWAKQTPGIMRRN